MAEGPRERRWETPRGAEQDKPNLNKARTTSPYGGGVVEAGQLSVVERVAKIVSLKEAFKALSPNVQAAIRELIPASRRDGVAFAEAYRTQREKNSKSEQGFLKDLGNWIGRRSEVKIVGESKISQGDQDGWETLSCTPYMLSSPAPRITVKKKRGAIYQEQVVALASLFRGLDPKDFI